MSKVKPNTEPFPECHSCSSHKATEVMILRVKDSTGLLFSVFKAAPQCFER